MDEEKKKNVKAIVIMCLNVLIMVFNSILAMLKEPIKEIAFTMGNFLGC